ncbi:MAG: SUMF1/EgtB/PvdO family nonheme iron enzyme [Magnetococcales bacterium]|nr:SUMF1/EgtB/PvdO family nonheme iron enzyme [Magnetococcales bacterium]
MKRWLMLFVSVISVLIGIYPVISSSQAQTNEDVNNPYRSSHALIIGGSSYGAGWPTSIRFRRKMQKLGWFLHEQGFRVTTIEEPVSDNFVEAFHSFFKTFSSHPDHQILIYFGGHSVVLPDREESYLVPMDAPPPDVDRDTFLKKALPFSKLFEWSRKLSARHVLFVVEGPVFHEIFRREQGDQRSHALGSESMNASREVLSRLPAFRTEGKPFLADGLVQGLAGGRADQNGDGYITGAELAWYLRQDLGGGFPVNYGRLGVDGAFPGQWLFTVKGPYAPAVQQTVAVVAEQQTVAQIVPEPTQQQHPLKSTRPTPQRVQNNKPVQGGSNSLLASVHKEVSKVQSIAPSQMTQQETEHASKVTQQETEHASKVTQQEIERSSAPKVWKEALTQMSFSFAPGGCFFVGSPVTEVGRDKDEYIKEVCVDPFWIAQHEVTQGQWNHFMSGDPSRLKLGPQWPVDGVSWFQAKKFIELMNDKTGGGFRLPTEAEWAYACRLGQQEQRYAGSNTVSQIAWYGKNSASGPKKVGRKQPNGLGLFDMSGNVWEWVEDHYQSDYFKTAPKHNPVNLSITHRSKRALRGGAYNSKEKHLRCANRFPYPPEKSLNSIGFRLARTVR